VLFHGRGTDEHDLFPLLDLLDPERRLLGVTPRGPLSLPPGGGHWYAVREIGYPDPRTFLPTFEALSEWLDALGAETGLGPERTILGGFSQGAVMSYALGLAGTRPRPAAIVALSGFIPTVEGFELAGARVLYREYPLLHAVDPGFLVELAPWISSALAAERSTTA
jgi:phospholipase/carboxylesterase